MVITWGDVTASILWALVMAMVVVAAVAITYGLMRRRERTFTSSMPEPEVRMRAEIDNLYAAGRIDRAEYERRIRTLDRRRR